MGREEPMSQRLEVIDPAAPPPVWAALRNEAQTWAELQDSTFGLQALQAAGGERMHWSPGYLGLLRLNQAQHFEPLRATPLQAVSEKLRYEAAAAYEQLATRNPDTTHSNPDLAQATLIALALREIAREEKLEASDEEVTAAATKMLEQYGHKIGNENDRDQGIAEFGAAGQVGRPIARVHIPDGDHQSRPGKGDHFPPDRGFGGNRNG